jgi:hypothetical protein
MLSLAMYGLWCFLHDLWDWFLDPRLSKLPSTSFLIVVKNREQEIEDMLRYLVREIETTVVPCDVVVVDYCSDDLTPTILQRLAFEFEVLHVVHLPEHSRPVAEALPLCRGAVVHVLDMSNRLNNEDFIAVVSALLRQNSREVRVNSNGN